MQEALRKVACGSEALKGGRAVSKDIALSSRAGAGPPWTIRWEKGA